MASNKDTTGQDPAEYINTNSPRPLAPKKKQARKQKHPWVTVAHRLVAIYQAMSRHTADDQLRFLLSCVKHSSNGRISFEDVATECGVVSRGAAAKRFERLMKQNGINLNSDQDDAGSFAPSSHPSRSAVKAGSASKKPSKPSNSSSTTTSRSSKKRSKPDTAQEEAERPRQRPRTRGQELLATALNNPYTAHEALDGGYRAQVYDSTPAPALAGPATTEQWTQQMMSHAALDPAFLPSPYGYYSAPRYPEPQYVVSVSAPEGFNEYYHDRYMPQALAAEPWNGQQMMAGGCLEAENEGQTEWIVQGDNAYEEERGAGASVDSRETQSDIRGGEEVEETRVAGKEVQEGKKGNAEHEGILIAD